MRLLRRRRDDAGFTLVELLVVIVIIGILAGVSVPLFVSQRRKAADASVKSDLRSLIQHQISGRLDVATYQTPRQLNAAGYAFRTSPRNVIAVISVSATEYCMVGSSAGSGADATNLGQYVNWNHKMYYATVATGIREATAADPGCVAGLGSVSNGWWNSTGYQDGALVLPN